MKTLTVAIIAAASLALCATSAKAGPPITTENSPVNISAVVTTNGFTETATGLKATIVSYKLVNKDLLSLLSTGDFANTPFAPGAKLVMGWDWGGALLVVDKTGTNILYNATSGNPSNTITINFYNQEGAISYVINDTGKASFAATWYNNASFALIDHVKGINLTAAGPSTEHFTLKSYASTNNGVWTDSQSVKMYGANETNSSPYTGTLTGSITANGNGTGKVLYQLEVLQDSGRVP
jgi:hypothetical protein